MTLDDEATGALSSKCDGIATAIGCAGADDGASGSEGGVTSSVIEARHTGHCHRQQLGATVERDVRDACS